MDPRDSAGRLALSAAIAAVVLTLLATPATAAPGDLDSDFRGTGTVTVDLAGGGDGAQALELQDDGKIVIGGYAQTGPGEGDLAVARLLADGSLDLGFGTGGKAFAGFGSGVEVGWGMTVDDAGRILQAGSAGPNTFSLARYTSSGQPDNTLAGDGTFTGDFGGTGSSARDVAAYGDGRIAVFGLNSTGGDYDFAAARLTEAGDYDLSFDGDGKVTVDLGTTFDVGSAGELLPDGRLLMSGVTGDPAFDCGVLRLTDAGAPDPGFGGSGFVLRGTAGTDYCDRMSLDPAGRILLTGRSEDGQSDPWLARLNPDGSFDPSFAGTGSFVLGEPGFTSFTNVATSPDGKIVAVGSTDTEVEQFRVARFNPDGSLDPTFSGDGVATAGFGQRALASDVAVLPDGDIVVGGTTYTPGTVALDMAVARFEGGPLQVELSAKPKQRIKKLRATLSCSLPCEASARGKGKAKGEKFKTKPAAATAGAQQSAALRLKLKRRDRKELVRRKGKVTIRVTATSGELTATDSLKVKLKR